MPEKRLIVKWWECRRKKRWHGRGKISWKGKGLKVYFASLSWKKFRLGPIFFKERQKRKKFFAISGVAHCVPKWMAEGCRKLCSFSYFLWYLCSKLMFYSKFTGPEKYGPFSLCGPIWPTTLNEVWILDGASCNSCRNAASLLKAFLKILNAAATLCYAKKVQGCLEK